jgi:YYY domain-containing protein
MTSEALAWWLVIHGIGLVALPITLLVFRRLPGAGYAFAKPLGLLLAAYLFWLALSLHVLPNRPGSIAWVLLLLIAIDVYLVRRRGDELRALIGERLPFILAVEAVFTLSFAAAVYLRSFVPEIAGTEKPMDFMLLNAASRSRYYPPDDAWLSGFDVSYYYFGYVIQAMIAKLSAAPTAVAFNLGLASTAALAAAAAFGLAYELVRLGRAPLRAGIAFGLVAALFLTVLGNLEGVVEFAVANGYASQGLIDRVNINDLNLALESDACLPSFFGQCFAYPDEESSFWWWWRATRISPDGNSITEFPFFSFLLGDLHPHVMAIPFVLTVFGLGLTFWRSSAPLSFDTWRRQPALLLLGAVLVGGLGFLNTWDLPAFLFLISLLVLARNLIDPSRQSLPAGERVAQAISSSVAFLLPLAVLAFVLYLPFYLSFSSQAAGIDAVQTNGTLPLHSVLFWGPLVAVSLPLPLALLSRQHDSFRARRVAAVLLLPLLLLVAWAGLIAVEDGIGAIFDAISARGGSWLTTLFFAGALGVSLLALWRALESEGDAGAATVPALIATTTAFLLVLGAELFYVEDVFRSRLNTVFKLYYQAWILLSVSGAFSIYWLVREWQPERNSAAEFLRGAWGGLAALVLAGALLYPLGATLSRTEGLARPGRTLDGLAAARRGTTNDFEAATWLRQRAGRDEIIVEATGGQYSNFARVATWTGIPTVVGWIGHEVQWGRDDTMLAQRQQDVDRAYTTESLAEALTILRKYGVTYVFVGSLERSKYPPAGLQKFESGLSAVIEAGQSAVYRLPIAGESAGQTD